MRKVLSLPTLAIIIFSFTIAFAQNPAIQLVAYDSVAIPENISTADLRVINYNDDGFPDYYCPVSQANYHFMRGIIIDGQNGDTLWLGPEFPSHNLSNVVYVESQGIWRQLLLQTENMRDFLIRWCDTPSPDFSGEYDFHPDVWDFDEYWLLRADIGYMNDCNGIYIQICNGVGLDIGTLDYYGEIYLGTGYYAQCGRPVINREFEYQGHKYIWHIGDFYGGWFDVLWNWHDYFYSKVMIFRETSDSICEYSMPQFFSFDPFDPYRYADLYTADSELPPMQLLLHDYTLYLYTDVFDSTSSISIDNFYGMPAPRFFAYNHEPKIFAENNMGQRVALNTDLTVFRAIYGPEPYYNSPFHFQDVDGDGTDEYFLRSYDMIQIYKLEDVVSIDEPHSPLPRFAISNYPNPFNASTTIKYNLPRQSQVKLEIYDILGRKITTLDDSRKPAGYHQVEWNAADLSSGVYFYKLTAGDCTETRRMMLVK